MRINKDAQGESSQCNEIIVIAPARTIHLQSSMSASSTLRLRNGRDVEFNTGSVSCTICGNTATLDASVRAGRGVSKTFVFSF